MYAERGGIFPKENRCLNDKWEAITYWIFDFNAYK